MKLNLDKCIYTWNLLSNQEKFFLLSRSITDKQKNVKKIVNKIIQDIISDGDSSLKKYTFKFDNFCINNFYMSQDFIKKSKYLVSEDFKKSVFIAKKNIENFHIPQKYKNLSIETYPGVFCKRFSVPISSVGLYIPNGKFPLISTILMLLIPAKIAGCQDITICSPPPITKELAYIAYLFGIKKILQLGGAQAIAALSFGTESVQKVDKIFGPGNIFVTEAKSQVSRMIPGVTIDMPAGPSEVLIIADKFGKSEFIAADLLAQAEHDKNSQVILVTPDILLVKKVLLELKKQILFLNIPKLLNFAHQNRIILTETLEDCFTISNQYAPEHLMLHLKNSEKFVPNIINAGSVFLGSWTPESAGDYITGANHVLPTYGYAKTYSSINVMDFQKNITVQKMNKNSLVSLSKNIFVFSEIEGMYAHKNSVNVRLNYLLKKKIR